MDIRTLKHAHVGAPCACNYTWGPDGQPVRRMCRGHAARCTCPTIWHAIIPPPPCPVHGQLQMTVVTC